MLDTSLTARPQTRLSNRPPILTVEHLDFWYGTKQALIDVNLEVPETGILAFIGPSGCGKSTLLKCFNRMHDEVRDARMTGTLLYRGDDAMDPSIDPPEYRKQFGWVAQVPNPFAMSIWDNVAYGPTIHGCVPPSELAGHVEACLTAAYLWDEVKDRLRAPAHSLSTGQQQRLCIARALSNKPDVLLMDEPTASIDPVATAEIEELIRELGKTHAVIIITHSMMQARRLADQVAYFHLGHLVEAGATEQVFQHPRDDRTHAFIHGCFG